MPLDEDEEEEEEEEEEGSLLVSLDSLLVAFSQFCIQTGAITGSARKLVDLSQAKYLYICRNSLSVTAQFLLMRFAA